MPLAQISGLNGYLTQEQKQEIIEKVTDAIVSVEGEGFRPVTWVLLNDVPVGNWGIGGNTITVDDVKSIANT